MKRIAIFLCALPLLFSLACSTARIAAEAAPPFPSGVEFVVVDELPAEAESAGDQPVSCYVSASFYENGAPMRAVPVVLYSGDQALLAALTDVDGHIACGMLPMETNLLVVVSRSAGEAARAVVLLQTAQGTLNKAVSRSGAVALEPTAEPNGRYCLNVAFILGGTAAAQESPLPFADFSSARRVPLALF